MQVPPDKPEFTFVLSAPAMPVGGDTFIVEDLDGKAHTNIPKAIKQAFQRKKVAVDDDDVRGFLKEQLVPLGSAIANEAGEVGSGFGVDEIAFTIGVGVEGGLAFVAKASAEAAITVTLRRTH